MGKYGRASVLLCGYLLLAVMLVQSVAAATIQGSIYDESLGLVSDVKVGVSSEPRQQVVSKDGQYSFDLLVGDYVLTAYQVEDGQVVATAQEEVSIPGDGVFVLDVILFPNLDETLAQLSDLDELAFEDPLAQQPAREGWVVPAIITALVVVASVVATLLVSRGFQRSPAGDHLGERVAGKHLPDHKEGKGGLEVSAKAPVAAEGEQEAQAPGVSKKTVPGSSASTGAALSAELEKVVEVLKVQGGRTTQKELRKAFPLSEGKVSLMITELEHKGIVEKIKKGRGNVIILKASKPTDQ